MIQESPNGVTIHIRVIPRAKATEIAGTRHDAVLVRLAATPVDGAANAALTRFLADCLGVPVRSIEILSGEMTRHKRVRIAGVRAADVRARLGVS